MKLCLSLMFTALAYGQTLTLTGPATARPGQTISVSLTLASPPVSLAATQWSVTLPPGYTATAVSGAASVAAAKTLYCNSLSTTCLTVGVNANLYAAGVVATYSLVVPATAAPGPATIPISGVVGATLAGDAAVVNAGAAYTFTVLARTDLNGDGKTDLLDLQMLIQEILSGGMVANDQNGDGLANARDAQIVARAVMQ